MKITIDLSDELVRQARKRATDEGIQLREVIETALRSFLAGGSNRSGYRLRWRTERGRLRPGVNLDGRRALFDVMDGRS